MSIGLDIIGLLYRADWTRLSLAAEVSVTRERGPFASDDGDDDGLEPGRPPAGVMQMLFGGFQQSRSAGHEWEMVTDPMQADSSRSTLLIAPGGRFRRERGGFVSGCDGERNWQVDPDGGFVVPGPRGGPLGGPRPPLKKLLRPSWLLTEFSLTVGEPVTVSGRHAWPMVATPRPGVRDKVRPHARKPDRVEAIVDAELGILLRHAEILDGRTVRLTELHELSFDPASAADDAQFLPPGGWDAVPEADLPEPPGGSSSRPEGPAWMTSGPVGEAAKVAAGLVAGGLAGLRRHSSFDAFGQATQESPETAMPPDEAALDEAAPDEAAPVSDEMLGLLYRSEELWADGVSATLHLWLDSSVMAAGFPDNLRKQGFGVFGSLLDMAADRADTLHRVSRLRLAGPLIYLIDSVENSDVSRAARVPKTIICDGERLWRIYDDEVSTGPAEPLPSDVVDMLDLPGLLKYRLSGGSQTIARGRPGYNLHNAGDRSFAEIFSPDDVVVDAELGVVLRWITRRESRTLLRRELRDVTAGPVEPGVFQPDIPPHLRVVERPAPVDFQEGPPVTPAGQIVSSLARQAETSVRGFFDRLRGGDTDNRG